MMDLKYAAWLAGHLVERIAPMVERVEIAGSVRRQRETVGDIELVARPHLNRDLFAKEATPLLDDLRASLADIGTLVKNGDRYIRLHLTKADQYVDIFLVWPPAAWGSILAIRTGPADLGKYVVTRCRDFDIMHADGRARHIHTGELVPTETEEQFFSIAGLECVPPEKRDEQLASLQPGGIPG